MSSFLISPVQRPAFRVSPALECPIVPQRKQPTTNKPAKTMKSIYKITINQTETAIESDLTTFKSIFTRRGAENIVIFDSRINPKNKQIRFDINGRGFSATATLIK